MNFLVRSQNTVKTLVPQYIRQQSIASSANKSEKKGRDEFITMASPNHKQNAKDRLYVWGYAGLGALGKPNESWSWSNDFDQSVLLI